MNLHCPLRLCASAAALLLLLAGGLHPARADVNPSSAVAHWTFDEKTGTTAHDSISGQDGTLSGAAVFVPGGVSGNAVNLDRALGGLVNMGDVLAMTGGDFTVCVWINTTTIEPDTLVLGRHEGGISNGWFLNVNPTGGGGAANKATFYASDVLVAQSPSSSTSVNDGVWHHVVGVYRAGLTHSVYVDGSPAEASTPSAVVTDRGAPFLVGGVKQNGVISSRYTGLVDDVQVYARALSDAEIDLLRAHPGRALHDTDRSDLALDWSEDRNPNGLWMYREGPSALPHVGDWGSGVGGSPTQPGWARSANGNTFLPGWMKSNGTETYPHDWVAGDVVVHTTDDANGVGSGHANVVWTSPRSGRIDIAGGVWLGRDIGRSNDWFLYRNDTLLSQGSLASGDPYSRARPFALAAGSGGPAAVQDLTVAGGDTIRLELVRTSSFGDYVGVDLAVAFVTMSPTAATGDAAPGVTGARFAAFGPPSFHRSGGVAFRGSMAIGAGGVTKQDDAAVWADLGAPGPSMIAREGDQAPGTTALFSAFGDPVCAGAGRVAFVGVLKTGAGVTKANATGIWATSTGGPLTLVARQGSAALGAGTSKYLQFLSLALPDSGGPVFVAALQGATPATDVGLWTADDVGVPHLVAREGDQLTVGGGPRVVSSLRPLPASDPSKQRGFGDVASAAVRVTFVDKTQAVLAFPLGSTQPTVVAIGPGSWQAVDARLGVAGASIEDFEDTTLASGLLLQLSGGTSDYGPASMLARTIDPAADDPNPQAVLVPGIWDGSHVLLNRLSTVPFAYADPQWADVTFHTPGGASSIGFSVEQLEVAGTPLIVVTDRGTFGFALPSTGNFVLSDATGRRNAYVRIDAGAGEKILSVKIDNLSGDGIAFDHVAYRPAVGLPARVEVAVSGTDAPVSGGKFQSLGSPVIDGSGRVAFFATLRLGGAVTRGDDAGIWAEDAVGLQLVAREGEVAPGTTARFATFGDPVSGEGDGIAFQATIAGVGTTKNDRAGVWTNAGGVLTIVARAGSAAPGISGGATYKSFGAVSLAPDGRAVFVAKLAGSPKTSDTGLFAADAAGAALLLLRTAGTVVVADRPKTILNFQYVPRSNDAPGVYTVRVVFTDRTEAIVRIVR